MPPAIANTATPRCSPSSSAMAEGGFQGESLGPRHLMSSRGCRRSSPQAIRREPSCSLTPWPGKRFGPGEKSARSARGGKTGAPADAKPVMCPAAQLRHIALLDPPEAEEAGRRIDVDAAERAASELLVALGADLADEGLRGTPRRMADAYAELLTSQPFRPTTFPNDEGYDELVLVRSIPFHSLCMHHLLPFHGVAHIGYLPGERILGLSKFARVVELFARDLQVQARGRPRCEAELARGKLRAKLPALGPRSRAAARHTTPCSSRTCCRTSSTSTRRSDRSPRRSRSACALSSQSLSCSARSPAWPSAPPR